MATSEEWAETSLFSPTNLPNDDNSLSSASSISESTSSTSTSQATSSNSTTQTNQSTCSLQGTNVEASPRNPTRPDLPFYDLRSGSTPKTPKTVIRKPAVKRTKGTQVSTKLVEVCAKVDTGRTTGGVRRGRPPANSNKTSVEVAPVAPSPRRVSASFNQSTSSPRPSTSRRSSIPLPNPAPSALSEPNTVPSEVEHAENNSQITDMEDTQYGIESIASSASHAIDSAENATVTKETVPVQRRRSFTINIQRSNQTTKIVVDGEDEVNITIPDEVEPISQGISTVPEAATPVGNKEKNNPKPCSERKSRSHRKPSKKSSSRKDRKKGRDRRHSRCDCCCYCSDHSSSSYSCSTCSSDSSFYTYSSDCTEYSPVSVKKSRKTHKKS